MSDIKLEAFRRAVKMLDGIGAKYGIIFDGKTYGTLDVVEPSNGRNYRYQRGETRKHYLPYIESMEVGDVAEVPKGDFDMRTLVSNISSYAVNTWGKGSAITKRKDESQTVEVLRLF